MPLIFKFPQVNGTNIHFQVMQYIYNVFQRFYSKGTEKLVAIIIKWIDLWCVGKNEPFLYLTNIFQVYSEEKTLSC